MIKKYKKKPVVIEAVLYDGTNFDKIKAFATDHIVRYSDNTLGIATLEGNMQALVGDYIIKGIKGEFYPCKPDIFLESYEPLEKVIIRKGEKTYCLDDGQLMNFDK